MSEIPEAAVEAAAKAVAETGVYCGDCCYEANCDCGGDTCGYPYCAGCKRVCNSAAHAALKAAMPAIRQQIDAQPEVIDAWYALVDHEAFTPCRDEEAPLLDSMLDRLTNLVDIESAVTELRRETAR